ncbi:unnamed protein product [Porites lobata]|uniref:Uncharacterized protein n=1 Tax=Porites lobata TaxID=104759 RepID=A0ABN8QTG9_9CNID|nr:unnamed protein product [Porites lobata]
MTARIVFRVYVLALLLYSAVTQKCPAGGRSESSIVGWMLRGHVYDTLLAELPFTCVFKCREDNRCQSFNWVISLLTCEFNNRTKEARPEDFIPNQDRSYYRRDLQRVPLGSIQELPAETCDEIKRSEGHAVSGKYWFSTIKSGTSVLAYCNTETNDIDECGASTPVCDIHANCSNTRGSYTCTCRAGYTGDGKTCQDIDECGASSPVCDINANCSNTRGSYICTCRAGYTGDGKTCQDIDECGASSPVCDINANCSNTRGSYICTCKSGYTGDEKMCQVEYFHYYYFILFCLQGAYDRSLWNSNIFVFLDIDECSASSPVCDVNANCSNTRGSYICTCKAGYNGDGKICRGFAEGLTDSVIVGDNVHHLANLSTWLKPVAQSESSKWKRCWRASVDGWAASTFHSRCDNKGPTVTIIRVGGTYIFGGYTKISWSGSGCQARYDSQAFLFSLVNKPGWAPVKLPQTGQHSSNDNSIYDCSSYGPIFGGGHDIIIYNYAPSSGSSSTNLGYSYSPPSGYNYGDTFTQNFLAGTYNFTPDELEIFYETT